MQKKYLFGVATAAHQIEGDNFNNDWYKYEKDMGVSSGKAVNSFELFEEDIKNIKALGCNSYRFSIEWSRIEPKEGEYDEKSLEFYLNLIKRLFEEEIEPIITLHHFTNPLWFEEKGGWRMKNSSEIFKRYLEFLVPKLPKNLKYFVTFNEPNVFIASKYIVGLWHPFEKNDSVIKASKTFNLVAKNIIDAHTLAYRTLKESLPEAMVSICVQHQKLIPRKNYNFLLNKIYSKILSKYSNYFFYDKVKDSLDFLSMNIYTRAEIWFNIIGTRYYSIPDTKKKDFMRDYDQRASDIKESIIELYERYNLPVLISESGTPNGDEFRIKYLKDIFSELKELYELNIPVIGYMHWTLMDNFEWNHGYNEKFGLFRVDLKTFERTPKESAKVYKELIEDFEKDLE